MVKEDRLDLIFYALSDRTRRGILSDVATGNPSVGELGKPYAMSGPAISKHLKVLERAGLIARVKEGKVNRFTLSRDPLAEVVAAVRGIEGAGVEKPVPQPETPAADELEDYLL